MSEHLLRALQERFFFRLGSECATHSDFRVVAATNRDLYADMMVGTFREDLFYRPSVINLSLPPVARETRRHTVVGRAHAWEKMKRLTSRATPKKRAALKRSEAFSIRLLYRSPGFVHLRAQRLTGPSSRRDSTSTAEASSAM
jgi:transcriptional regulator with GAF, ATPase, and Fis domain